MPKIMRYILVTFLSFWKKICFVSVSFLMVEKFNGFPFLMNPKFNGTFLIRAFFIKKWVACTLEQGLLKLLVVLD